MENQIIVIDTDIIINYFKAGAPSLEKYLRLQAQDKLTLKVSSVTVFEYFSGVSLLAKDQYYQAEELFKQFSIQEVNEQIAKIAAQINYERKLYQYINLADILIGATALYLDASLLTENQKHFKLIPALEFAQ